MEPPFKGADDEVSGSLYGGGGEGVNRLDGPSLDVDALYFVVQI